MNLQHKTTREHYEKYAELSKNIPTACVPRYNDPKLLELYKEDKNLNNIPLREFDLYYRKRSYEGRCISLSENCCLLKHILIYRVLGAEPEFED